MKISLEASQNIDLALGKKYVEKSLKIPKHSSSRKKICRKIFKKFQNILIDF
jgi:hypothetical protein